jgi:desulfoferrodoxin-like iron-binding protein
MVEANRAGQTFKCETCGNVVEVKEAGGGELVCCGEPMKPMD